MVGKMPNVTWLEGSCVETIKGWQSTWFYITEPRDTKWVVAPKFRSGFPTRLTSWKEKGLSWGSSVERDGLPQGKLPLLAREYPADEHNLDYVDKLELLIHHVLNT